MDELRPSRFRRSLYDPDRFTLTFELVPGRSGRSKGYNRTLALARQLAADGRLQAVSITENAGGHPALSPEVLGGEILAMGLDVIIHLSCKDKNRNQMESLLYAWDREGLSDLLVISGDYPQQGYRGDPKPVFDLGSVQVLDLLAAMNRGGATLAASGAAGSPLPPTSFLKGVAVSPFKRLEAEQMMQYYKLHRKVAAGADYVITQVGYDARKFHELLLYMEQNGLNVPVLGNVFIPNLAVVEIMYRGGIPGCAIPESLYVEMKRESEAPDRGRRARLVRGAKLLAVLEGMGYAGAHIGGPGLTCEDFDFLVSEAQRLAPEWRQSVPDLCHWFDDGFFLFEADGASGLNRAEPARRGVAGPPSLAYRAAHLVHELAFEPEGPLFDLARNCCLALDETRLRGGFATVEHLLKFIAFGCRNCGDCTLAELAFVCPQSGCAKNLLNGPCGGSRDGWCEVYPGKRRCLYVRVYERLKRVAREGEMRRGFVPPRDWSLNETSSWVNFYRGRDHAGGGR